MNATENATILSNKEVVSSFLNVDIEGTLSYMREDVQMGWHGFFELAPEKQSSVIFSRMFLK